MASCFHDQQEFKSDLKIEVARENDILKEDQELKDIECEKNPGHHGFIPFTDLDEQHLPEEDRDKERLDIIKRSGSRVVRLVVRKREKIQEAGTGLVVDKIKQEAGTGFVIKLNNLYFIKTNNHVVKCDEEVKNCDVEFNYNSYDRSNISISKGKEFAGTCPYRDITLFTFDPVPEFIKQLNLVDIGDMYPTIVIIYRNKPNVKEMTIGHPKSSQIIYYTGIDINDEQIYLMRLVYPDKSNSYMKSRYFRFQPIPSNIQDLTKIKIHVDEDDGNRRVISGDVVKFGGEYVIKISESIFQDEVKKCKIVRNGKVISRGTRLYFEYFKSREFFSDRKGVDLEDKMKRCPTNVWLFDCHPTPRPLVNLQELMNNVTPTNNWCCIGHPHGGIKMVTFGRLLGESIERFDNKYRHIVQLEEGCKCKKVTCMNYSCKTCPGSSGSVIYPLQKKPDISEGPAHFMGKRVKEYLPDGVLIENINMAWIG